MKTRITKNLKYWFFMPMFLVSLMVSAQSTTLEDICATLPNAPVLTETIASYPLTDLSDAAGNNNSEIIPGISISEINGLCIDNGIVDNFDDLESVLADPDVLSLIAGFDAAPVVDNFDPDNFGVKLEFNLSYFPPVDVESNGIVALGGGDPYLNFLGIVYDYVSGQIGVLLNDGNILYAEVSVPLNQWHTVEVKHLISEGAFVYLNGELVLAVNTIAIDTEQVELDLSQFDVSGLTLEGALDFVAGYAGLADGYEFCLRNIELYKCVPGALEVPSVTEECEISLEAPTAWDICSGTVTATTEDSTEYTMAGDYIVNWTFTSANGAGVLNLTQDVTVTASPENDSDGDGVCDEFDICPGFDDNVDDNENGIPDGCEAATVDNCPDDSVNLALLDDATLSGSVADGDGRGTPLAILYDPLLEDYRIRTKWNEYGVRYLEDLGTPDADNGYFWRVDWASPKAINYITVGGMYPNQPQPNALWRVSYLYDGEWTTLDEGQGGWLVNGIYEYDGTDTDPIIADAMRIQVYSDGVNEISSIHLRGRGGISTKINDSATTPKATLFMYLPQQGAPVADFTVDKNMLDVDFDASASTDDGSIVNYQFDFGDGTVVNSASPMVSHTYAESGTYEVKLILADNDGIIGVVIKNVTVSDGAVTNDPDENTNLALLDDATLSGSVADGDGRGTPLAILYDPLIDDYRTRTDWNEYGVGVNENLGRPDADNGFLWQVDWEAPKAINYVTIGGMYPNQPQPNALWRVSYLSNGEWITLDEGQGGWLVNGIFQWDGRYEEPIVADAMRVQIYSDGNSDIVSIHLRGRGGVSNNINDTAQEIKATLIQYLPPLEPVVNEPDADINLALLDEAVLSGSVSNGRGTPMAILYDPLIDDYRMRTSWNEYGVGVNENLGRPDADNGFLWQVDWASEKTINYVTIGGTYPNQPQPNALWRVSYLNDGDWITLDEGQGGWIDSGIYEWDGRSETPIVADAMRVQVYSDGNSDLVSIHLRGRGGISNNIDDSATTTKATLIQYLPSVAPPSSRGGESLSTMRISPNPTSGFTSVSFREVTEIEMIEIFDLTGRQVQKIDGGKIDKDGKKIYVHNLPQGIYNVRAITLSGNVYQEKLIVKK